MISTTIINKEVPRARLSLRRSQWTPKHSPLCVRQAPAPGRSDRGLFCFIHSIFARNRGMLGASMPSTHTCPVCQSVNLSPRTRLENLSSVHARFEDASDAGSFIRLGSRQARVRFCEVCLACGYVLFFADPADVEALQVLGDKLEGVV